jgi:hypothetical protein
MSLTVARIKLNKTWDRVGVGLNRLNVDLSGTPVIYRTFETLNLYFCNFLTATSFYLRHGITSEHEREHGVIK